MALKRKGENETSEERAERLTKESVSNHATRSEKTAWNRKHTNLQKLIEKDVHPIENKILELQTTLQPAYDQVRDLRNDMVSSCTHPYDLLVLVDEVVICKFCDKKLIVSIRDRE